MSQEVKVNGRPAKLLWREAYMVGVEFLDNPGKVEPFDSDELMLWQMVETGKVKASTLMEKLPRPTPEQRQQVR